MNRILSMIVQIHTEIKAVDKLFFYFNPYYIIL
nr:MAG TPA: hypothetical protein [Bacteriophage sp.]DAS26391.1 MAG TPA: hypothetical protein [Caudoviricetes sp.]